MKGRILGVRQNLGSGNIRGAKIKGIKVLGSELLLARFQPLKIQDLSYFVESPVGYFYHQYVTNGNQLTIPFSERTR